MDEIKKLLYLLSIGCINEEDYQRLKQWAEGNEYRIDLLNRLSDEEYLADRLSRRMHISIERPMKEMSRQVSGIRLKQRFKRYGVASAIISIVGALGYITYSTVGKQSFYTENALAHKSPHYNTLSEIRPGSTKAILYRDGEEGKVMTSADSITIGTKYIANSSDNISELCLDVPRGGEFKIMLEDSTEVWLNSESKLYYPETFTATERRVQIEGEGYFIVKKDARRPFIVETKLQTVKVYGTSFNIKAYADDETICTTLEKGSVAIVPTSIKSSELRLSPGHQSILNRADSKVRMKVVDPTSYTSWRQGRFVFEEQPLKYIMRDLARWYDFKYRFEDKSLENVVFMGSIPRYSNFTTARKIIEQIGDIAMKLEGDMIVISAKSTKHKQK